ncbi:MAG: ABC transporter permease [Hyphomicrobiaceae bacterium]|nr:ABC transporter permease [Hyphomicrobiaceae bacterium]
MSGSYDDGRGPLRHTGQLSHAPDAPYYDDAASTAPQRHPPHALDPAHTRPGHNRHTYAPPQPSKRDRPSAAIVQAGSVTGQSLTLVISIMCFLACLTAGAVYMINQSASAWLRNIASEITVQIEPRANAAETDRLVKDAHAFLSLQPGIINVRIIDKAASAKLLEPWLGSSAALGELPIPRLIALEVDRSAPPTFDRLRASLAKQFPGVTLDDHRHWRRQIRTVTRSFALGGLAILFLVGAATTAIIVSATRSAMASNREIVEVLHFVGATDRFIAREFERHFLTLGIRAGVVGAGLAMAVFFFMPMAVEFLGGGTITMAEMKRLVGSGVLDGTGYFILALVVAVIAALCMLTSRFGVYRILHSQS